MFSHIRHHVVWLEFSTGWETEEIQYGAQIWSKTSHSFLDVTYDLCSMRSCCNIWYAKMLNVSPPAMTQTRLWSGQLSLHVFEVLLPAVSVSLLYPPRSTCSLSKANEGSLVTVHDYHTDRIISHWFYADDHLSVYAGLMVVVIYRRKSITLLVCRSNCLLFSY